MGILCASPTPPTLPVHDRWRVVGGGVETSELLLDRTHKKALYFLTSQLFYAGQVEHTGNIRFVRRKNRRL